MGASRCGAPPPFFCSLATILVFSFLPTCSLSLFPGIIILPAHQTCAVLSRMSIPSGVLLGFSSPSTSSRTGSHSGSPMGYAIITAPRIMSTCSDSSFFVSGFLNSTCFLLAAMAASSSVLRSICATCGMGALPSRLPLGSLQNVSPRGACAMPSASAWMSSSNPCLSGGLHGPYAARSSPSTFKRWMRRRMLCTSTSSRTSWLTAMSTVVSYKNSC
mmetsp:Transcript_7917/g.20110  ORF Transcript_7917/g.20110 Transcript_7917/m.20110 type:complete len:217 (-) Transcript_7917:115-765(-)